MPEYPAGQGVEPGGSIEVGPNIAIGLGAGSALTTAVNVIAIGGNAVGADTGTNDLIGIGYGALRTTTGANHIALGTNAGNGLTTGTNDILIGKNVGQSLGTGYSDVFIGPNVATSANGDYECVAIGESAGNALVGTHFHTLVGAYAGAALTTGSIECTAFGHSALKQATTATAVVAVGRAALNAHLDGAYDIAIGHAAGYYDLHGSWNIYIGDGAGNNASDVTKSNVSGNNGIYIGMQASPTAPNLNQAGAIGALATVSVSSALVIGADAALGASSYALNLGIGAPSPAGKLDIRPEVNARIGLFMKLTAGHTASAVQVQDSTGATVFEAGPQGRMGFGTGLSATAMLNVLAGSAHPGTAVTLYGSFIDVAYPATTTTSAYNVYSRVRTAAAAFVLTSAYAAYVESPVIGAGSTISNLYGLYVANQGGAGVTAAIGVYVAAQTGIGIRLDAATTRTLHVSANADNTTIAAGITFGASADTDLYRGAAAVLRTSAGIRADKGSAIGVATNTDRMLAILSGNPHLGSAVTLYGTFTDINFPSTTTTSAYLHYTRLRTAAAAFTIPAVYGYYLESPIIGAGSTVTSLMGINIANQGNAGVGTSFGMLIVAQNGSATNSYGARIDAATSGALWLSGGTSPTDITGAIIWRADKAVNLFPSSATTLRTNAALTTARNAAPADGDLAANDMAIWFDPTNGAAKLMVKAKEAGGTVRTGSLALA